MSTEPTEDQRPGVFAVLARASAVLDAVANSPVRSRIRLFSRLSQLEEATRSPVAAILYQVGCESGASVDDVGRLISGVTCPVVLIPELLPGGARVLAKLCKWREHVTVLAHAPTQLRLDLADLIAPPEHDRAGIVPRMINAIQRSLPEEVDDYRIFDAVLAQKNVHAGDVATVCKKDLSVIAKKARALRLPTPRDQHGYHRSTVAIDDVIGSSLPEKQVAPNRGFSSTSNLSHQVKTHTGRSIRDWKKWGGVDAALEQYVSRFDL